MRGSTSIILTASSLILSLFTGCRPKASGGSGTYPAPQVVAVAAVHQTVAETLALVGTITANEIVEIKSETDGVVEEIGFVEGELVEKGRLLVRLDESKLNSSLAESEAALRLAQADYDRAQALKKSSLLSQQEYEQTISSFEKNRATVELEKRRLRDARIHAPFQGRVGARSISPGQVIARNTTLTVLVNADPAKVEFNVPERFLGQLKVGQPISVAVAAYSGRAFAGEVFFLSPALDATNRTALVKARIPNAENELKPGMFASLDLTLRVRENAVVIPEVGLAQIMEGEKAMVLTVDAATNAVAKVVKLGLRLPGKVEVESGLEAGEKVIVEGLQKVVPGRPVRLAPPEAALPYLDPVKPKG